MLFQISFKMNHFTKEIKWDTFYLLNVTTKGFKKSQKNFYLSSKITSPSLALSVLKQRVYESHIKVMTKHQQLWY